MELGGQESGFWVLRKVCLGGFERDDPLWFLCCRGSILMHWHRSGPASWNNCWLDGSKPGGFDRQAGGRVEVVDKSAYTREVAGIECPGCGGTGGRMRVL